MSSDITKRVALMTWFSYENYGIALQAMALYHVLSMFGAQPDLINYRSRVICTRNEKMGVAELALKAMNKVHDGALTPLCAEVTR